MYCFLRYPESEKLTDNNNEAKPASKNNLSSPTEQNPPSPMSRSNPTPKPKEPVKTPSYRRALALLAIVAIALVLGIPLVFAGSFIMLGFNSIGYYGPPIGQVMTFYYNAAV